MEMRKYIRGTRVERGPEIKTDHKLLIAEEEMVADTVKPALNKPFIKRNLSSTEIFSGPVTLGLKKMLNILD
jgi:hypothetical protein